MADKGRPTKYTPELVAKAYDYLENWRETGDMIPSIEGLSIELDITRTTLYDWRDQEEKKDISYILEKILAKQHRELVNSGLSGDFNSAIAKLALGKHGYSDKVDTDITSKGKAVKSEWHIHPVTTKSES
jgi:hypothetical protein